MRSRIELAPWKQGSKEASVGCLQARFNGSFKGLIGSDWPRGMTLGSRFTKPDHQYSTRCPAAGGKQEKTTGARTVQIRHAAFPEVEVHIRIYCTYLPFYDWSGTFYV
jgi:hypothetical protein